MILLANIMFCRTANNQIDKYYLHNNTYDNCCATLSTNMYSCNGSKKLAVMLNGMRWLLLHLLMAIAV